MTYTLEQIAAWQKYEHVRQSGSYNMIMDHGARMATGLSNDEYIFCMKNYSSLRDCATKATGEAK